MTNAMTSPLSDIEQRLHPLTCGDCGTEIETALCPGCQQQRRRSTSNAQNPLARFDQRGFSNRCSDSHEAVELVGRWLGRSGIRNVVEPLKIAPSWEQREEFFDAGDITLLSDDGTDTAPLEVKWTTHPMNFDDPAKPVWKYNKFFFCRQKNRDRYRREDRWPVCWISMSPCLQYAGVVHADSRHQWIEFWPRRAGTNGTWDAVGIKRELVHWYRVQPLPQAGARAVWFKWDPRRREFVPGTSPLMGDG